MDGELKDKNCPFRKERCDPDCQMLISTEDRMIKQCAFAVIALQLDELTKKGRGKF